MPATMLGLVEDGQTEADEYQDQFPRPGSAPPDCEAAEFSPPWTLEEWFEMVVNDAQP